MTGEPLREEGAKENMAKTIKKTAWEWCSKYIRLRDSQNEYCKCCTCGAVKHWKRVDAGHFIGRGLGGSSGVYFDERNIHAQCKQCNGFKQGAPHEYEQFMLDKYGQGVIDELRWLHKKQSYKHKLHGVAEMYKTMYLSLCAQRGIQP